jgi:hypothetical protein
MEAFMNRVMELTGNYVTPHGLYIPGGESCLYYWSWGELIVLTLAATVLFLISMSCVLAREVEETGDSAGGNFMVAVDSLLPPGDACAPDREAAPVPLVRAGIPDAADLERFYRSFPSETMLSDIIYAIRDEGLLDIVYMDGHGDVTSRVIKPLEMINFRGRVYLKAFCLTRKTERTFRLGRIIGVHGV